LNGVLNSSKAMSGSLAVGTGALTIGGNPTWHEWFKGDMDDVRVWNKPLTASQIVTDMGVNAAGAGAAKTVKATKASAKTTKKPTKRSPEQREGSRRPRACSGPPPVPGSLTRRPGGR